MSSNNSSSSSSKRRLWLVLMLVIVSAGIALSFIFFGHKKSVAYYTEPVERGSVIKVVNATGTVQPVVTVQVGSQVSGQIQALYADFNSIVKRGDLLAKIDPRNFQAQVADAQASLAAAKAREQSAKADLSTMQANLVSARANLDAARVTRDNDALNYKRYQEMSHSGIIAENDYDNAKATSESSVAKYNQAAAAVEQAQAQIRAQQAQVKQAEAQVKQAEADLDDKRVSLEYTNIFSPVDGVVISRNVDVGQTVAAGLQAPLLFVIANDLAHMQVNASVDEADIGHITPNTEVQFTVDAFSNRSFSGKILEVRLDPQTVQNVVTYSVIIGVDNRDLYLKPGMTANITMTVDRRENVLKIPNAALRYLPQGVTRAEADHMETVPKQVLQTAGESGRNPRPSGLPVHQSFKNESEVQYKSPNRSGSKDESREETHQKAASRTGSDAEATFAGQAPGQLWNPSNKIQFPVTSGPTPKSGSVWILDSKNKPVRQSVMLGITDGIYTEMLSGKLRNGEPLIVADTSQEASDTTQIVGLRGSFGGVRRH